jgi:hypothetical protein
MKLGSIDDIMIDEVSGKAIYAVMSPGRNVLNRERSP